MLSFWEKRHFLNFDLIVIGGGIVGLSTAIQYKKIFPDKKVLILERGVFPSGASTKNAGFACFGSLTEILDDLGYHSQTEVLRLVEKRFLGLQAIRKEFGDESLGYAPTGGFELITQNELKACSELENVNSLLRPLFGSNVFEELKDIKNFGFSGKVLKIIKNKFEGELDTGKFIQSLWHRCQSLNIQILTGAEVAHLAIENCQVSVQNGGQSIDFNSRQIALCTNAFTKKIISDLDIHPGRGLVMVTPPLSRPIPWTGSFHFDKGYVYFRNVDNRILLGGGRNIDFLGEEDTDFIINPKIKDYLKMIYEEIIMPGEKAEFEMEWTGIMAFGKSKAPIIKLLTDQVGIAARLGGMGVAIGWHTGGELAGLLSKV